MHDNSNNNIHYEIRHFTRIIYVILLVQRFNYHERSLQFSAEGKKNKLFRAIPIEVLTIQNFVQYVNNKSFKYRMLFCEHVSLDM